jgi:hypothetical protein
MKTAKNVVRTIAAATLALHAGLGVAAVHCVGTGDDLNSVLDEHAGWESETIIRLRQGTYTSDWYAGSAPEFYLVLNYRYALGDVHISGGWNSDCSEQTLDPNLTRLDGQHRGTVFGFYDPWVTDRLLDGDDFLPGKYSLTNLSLVNGKSIPGSASALAASLDINGVMGTTNTEIRFEHLVITGSHAATSGAPPKNVSVSLFNGGRVVFRNNVVSDNDLSAHSGSTNVAVNNSTNAVAYVSSNSIHDNHFGNDNVGLYVVGLAELTNNAIANNTSSMHPTAPMDLEVGNPSQVALRNNHFSRYVQSGFAINSATTSGDAQWTKNGIVRIPNATSVIRNSGTNTPPIIGLTAQDIRGVDRIIESTVDRGAVESVPDTAFGPKILSLDPINNATTIVSPESGEFWTETLYFLKESGFGDAQSVISCDETAGEVAIAYRPLQTVKNVSLFVLPVGLVFPAAVPGAPDQHSAVVCTVYRENAATDTLTYNFVVQRSDLFKNGFD